MSPVNLTWFSCIHLCNAGLSLAMLLREILSASNREIVVCEKSSPDILTTAAATSPCDQI